MSDDRPSITCPRCDRTSYHPDDVANGYCGACHDFHKYPDERPSWERDMRGLNIADKQRMFVLTAATVTVMETLNNKTGSASRSVVLVGDFDVVDPDDPTRLARIEELVLVLPDGSPSAIGEALTRITAELAALETKETNDGR